MASMDIVFTSLDVNNLSKGENSLEMFFSPSVAIFNYSLLKR